MCKRVIASARGVWFQQVFLSRLLGTRFLLRPIELLQCCNQYEIELSASASKQTIVVCNITFIKGLKLGCATSTSNLFSSLWYQNW